jgi:hypothetical protein
MPDLANQPFWISFLKWWMWMFYRNQQRDCLTWKAITTFSNWFNKIPNDIACCFSCVRNWRWHNNMSRDHPLIRLTWRSWSKASTATDIASSRTFTKAEISKVQSFQFCANGSNSWLKLIDWSWSCRVVYLRTSPEVAWARVKEQAVHSVKEEQVASRKQF